jgi:hypothetical protein
MAKSFLASKTLWVNTAALVATGTGFFAGSLSSYPTTVAILVLIQSIANLALRFMTKTPVTLSLKGK